MGSTGLENVSCICSLFFWTAWYFISLPHRRSSAPECCRVSFFLRFFFDMLQSDPHQYLCLFPVSWVLQNIERKRKRDNKVSPTLRDRERERENKGSPWLREREKERERDNTGSPLLLMLPPKYLRCSVLQCVAVCCSVLQCVAVCYSALHCVAVWHGF